MNNIFKIKKNVKKKNFKLVLYEKRGFPVNRSFFREEYNYDNSVNEEKEIMRKEICDFLKSFDNDEKIFIFGAGNVAKRLCKEFKKNGKLENIKAFIVSSKINNEQELNGIPIREYIEFKDEPEKILIGLWETEQEKIYFELIKNGINKSRIIKIPFLINKALDFLYRENEEWEGTEKYWEERYKNGGNSGTGSYNRLAEFKAEIINRFVKEHKINSVIEWGCGDGNQLLLADYAKYIGYDISEKAVDICQKKYERDNTKKFIWCGKKDFKNEIKADLALSLDVIFHLIEDNIYQIYMERLFDSSLNYVCIYSCNFEKNVAKHVRCRRFTDYVEMNYKEWKLIEYYPNRYPYKAQEPDSTSCSEFFFYQKQV